MAFFVHFQSNQINTKKYVWFLIFTLTSKMFLLLFKSVRFVVKGFLFDLIEDIHL